MDGRRRMVRSEQISVMEASNLRDLLRQDERRDSSLAGLTLAAVLGCEEIRRAAAPTRTLLEIINDEESGAAYRGLALPNRPKPWKSFKDRLRLRRAGAAWSNSATNPVSASDFTFEDCNIVISDPIPVPPALRIPHVSDLTPADREAEQEQEDDQSVPVVDSGNTQNSIVHSSDSQNPIVDSSDTQNSDSSTTAPIRLAAALEAEREEQRRTRAIPQEEVTVAVAVANVVEETTTEVAAAAPMRMSLMALLEETDREAGVRYMIEEEEEVEDEEMGDAEYQEVEEEGEGRGGVEFVCCVCMVRHKGAAFIPCGHTFCRLCSRELWVSRGNCPLCNGYILEILDIF